MRKQAASRVDDADVISEAEGRTENYIKTYDGLFLYDDITSVNDQQIEAQIVWADDVAYILDPISMMPTNSYVKGAVKGDKITMTLPQTLYVDEYEYDGEIQTTTYLFTTLDHIDIDGMAYYMPTEGESQITYTIAEDGTVTLDALPEGRLVGISLTDGYEAMWAGFAESAAKYTPGSEVSVDPSTLPNTPYSYFTYGYGDAGKGPMDFGYKVNVAFDGDDVYFTGLSIDEPRWWFKGHRQGNQVIVDNNQKMGMLMGVYTVSLMFGKEDAEAYGGYSLLPADTQFVFNFNEEKKEFTTATPEVIMFVNALPDQLYFLSMIENPTFIYQPTAAGNPRNPWNLVFDARPYKNRGFGLFDFNLPIVSTDGVLLDRNNMYYQIYLDGELVSFEDQGLEDTTDIPYNHDGNAIVCQKINTGHEMAIDYQGFDKIGVKLFNVYDGVTYESDLVEVPFIEGALSGISDALSQEVVSETLYDLSGRRVSASGKGIYVKKTTYADGSVKTSKIAIGF